MAGGVTHYIGLGRAIFIVTAIVTVAWHGLGWAGLSGTYARKSDSRYWARLGYRYRHCYRYRGLAWAERHLWPEM